MHKSLQISFSCLLIWNYVGSANPSIITILHRQLVKKIFLSLSKTLDLFIKLKFFFGHTTQPAGLLNQPRHLQWKLGVFFFFFFLHLFLILNPSPSSLPIPSLWVVSVHQPQASSIMQRTWTGDLFHIWYYTCFNAILPNHPTLSLSHRVQKTVLYICVSFAVSHKILNWYSPRLMKLWSNLLSCTKCLTHFLESHNVI